MVQPMSLIEVTLELSRAVSDMTFSAPVTHVYNPLAYAWEPHRLYLERYGRGERDVIMLGMNPGPFGLSIPYEAGRA
jgi:single-strand selective monofunctional uracil DNA glycosylase